MAKFRLFYRIYPNPSITIHDREEISKEVQVKLCDMLSDNIEESWHFDDDTEMDLSSGNYFIEKDGKDLIVGLEMEIQFESIVYGNYDPGRLYGPMEDCYPPEVDFDNAEIEFREKEFIDKMLKDIELDDELRSLNITSDDIESECHDLEEYDDYEMEDEFDDEW